MRDLARRYLPAGDLRQGETALAKIVAEREDPFLVLISTILSQRTRDEMTEQRLVATVPKEYWLLINELFIRFGKDLCRPIGPICPRCSFTEFCRFYPRTKWGKATRRAVRRPQVHRSRRRSLSHD